MPPTAGASELREIEHEIEDCYNRVLKPQDQWNIVRTKERCKYPMILVIGNYSSGKSTFINSVLEREGEQDVGAAPTDSGFTLLLKESGDGIENEIKGSAVISDPDLGFEALRQFGPGLEGRLRLKKIHSQSETFPENLIVVDTPGLTDFGTVENDLFSKETVHASIQWFAERSDLILFLFDPEKPGGGEQQEVLLNLLKTGMEGKLRYIFNKTDKLQTTQDFVMTFGTLCWNLSKYVPRKEPPMFYTIYTEQKRTTSVQKTMESALEECKAKRADLLQKISKVPLQRADNLIEQTEDAILRIKIASKVCNEMLYRGRKRRRTCIALICLVSFTLCCVLAGLFQSVEEDDPFSPVILYSFLFSASLDFLIGVMIRQHLHRYLEDILRSGLEDCFKTAWGTPITHDIDAVWRHVLTSMDFTPTDISVFHKLKKVEEKDFGALRESEATVKSLHEKAESYRVAMGKYNKLKKN
eukprot:TRINITY_DN13857_c0_g1_i1.p1 TRINITY_DN13857_c0_g1~~TRINITY_DN13857_c0_g1_i1.p1  ORF type:complete len:485 (+),score=85.58 TRINITY_DN13857_c0_g1_i1:45-1457(+)